MFAGWVPRSDGTGLDLWIDGRVAKSRDFTDDERATRDAAIQVAAAAEQATAALAAHRDALADARAILLEYRYGAPGTPTFPEVLSPVQTAVIDYRDSGIKDAECDRLAAEIGTALAALVVEVYDPRVTTVEANVDAIIVAVLS